MESIDLLLVEDSMVDAQLFERIIRKNNLVDHFYRCKDGEDALNFLMNEQHSIPSLILLDIKMPKISGLEVLKEIRANDRTCMIPVIIYSASARPDDVKTAYKLGANSYLVKPNRSAELKEMVAGIVHYWLNLNHHIL